MKQKTFRSDVSGTEFPVGERVPGRSLRKKLLELIQEDHPEFTGDSYLSQAELDRYRERHIAGYFTKEAGELEELERKVLAALSEGSTLSDKVDGDKRQALTLGQKVADQVATFGGSWAFITLFGVLVLGWIVVNAVWLTNRGFDPYPFILLNLILSCVAALQAPVIMMSQNRQEEKDRERSKRDYMIDLKAELEIRMLHEKLDHLTIHQQQELLETQRIQIEMMSEILQHVRQNTRQEGRSHSG